MDQNYNHNLKEDISPIKVSKMKTKIYNKLTQEILDGEIKPGETILIKDLANKYNVSITPIREALTKLENEEILKKEPYKSYELKKYSFQEIEKIYEARISIESQVVKLAAKRVDEQAINKFKSILQQSQDVIENKNFKDFNKFNSYFHYCIFKTAQNDYLFKMMNNLHKQIMILNYQASSYLKDFRVQRFKNALKEHKQVFEYIKNNDEKQASKLMTKHLNESLKRFSEN